MLNSLTALAAPAAIQRLTLLLNHVLASEPVAVERLKKHVGRRIVLRLERWPALLPEVPPLAFVVTAAGLVDWEEPARSVRCRSRPAGLGGRRQSGADDDARACRTAPAHSGRR